MLCIPRRVLPCPVPLQPATRIDNSSFIFCKAACRQLENFRFDFGCIDIIEITVVFPEPCSLCFQRIHHDKEFQLAQATLDLFTVRESKNRIEPLAEIAVHLVMIHHVDSFKNIVIGDIKLRQIIIGEVVFFCCGFAPHCLHERDEELVIILPVADLIRPRWRELAFREIGLEICLVLHRNIHVARNEVGHQSDICKALNIGVATQCIHTATTYTDITKNKLQHAHCANVLRTLGVLCPTESIHGCHRLCRARTFCNHLADFEELILWSAANSFNHFRRVNRNMFFKKLPDTTRMRQSLVILGITVLVHFIGPGRTVIITFGFIISGKQTIFETETFIDDQTGIGEMFDIFILNFVMRYAVVNDTGQKGNIGSLTDRCIKIGNRSRTGKARINDDQLCTAMLFCISNPFEATRMCFGSITTHDNDEIR